MVEIILKILGTTQGVVVGLSFKDDTTLERLAGRGFNTWRLDPVRDLEIIKAGSGVESIQSRLTVKKAVSLVSKHSTADILISRHILEHANDLYEFIAALRSLVKPDGLMVIEIPDCQKSLELCDYTMLWEEHNFYFTSATFKLILEICGLDIIHLQTYPYKFENSLVAFVRNTETGQSQMSNAVLKKELLRGICFSESFEGIRNSYHMFFKQYKKKYGKIAIFGAGHMSCTFISLFQLSDYIEFIVDDNPHKPGLFMPASRLPIVSSDSLTKEQISLCLLGLNPLNENKVVERNVDFTNRGGIFLSIFPSSDRYLLKETNFVNLTKGDNCEL